MDFELWQLPPEVWQLPLELWQLPLELWLTLLDYCFCLLTIAWDLQCFIRPPHQTASSDSLISQPHQTSF
jgi:hypothetical protein